MKIKVTVNYSLNEDEYTAIAEESKDKYKKGDSVKILRKNEADKISKLGYIEVDSHKSKRLTKREKADINRDIITSELSKIFGERDYEITGKKYGESRVSDAKEYILVFNNRYEYRVKSYEYDLYNVNEKQHYIR